MSSPVDRVRQLLLGINQDVISYQQMELLLKEQNRNLIGRNSQYIHSNNEKQTKLLLVLQEHADQRTKLLHSFSLQASSDGIKLLAARLPAQISVKMTNQWLKLEASVGRCKQLNDHNGRLLANQQLLIRKLLNIQDDFYQPPQL